MPLGLWKGNAGRHRETMAVLAGRHRETMTVLTGQHRETMTVLTGQHRETMTVLTEQHRETMEELIALRKEMTLMRIELTDAVKANTEAILRLIDRFDEWEGRPPGPPDLRSV